MYRYYVKDHGRKRLVEYPIKEAIQLAELIGFDFERETQYRWFLNQALNTLLPIGWKRESDPFGNIHFHNEKTQVTTKNNPLVYKFRKCFERLLIREMEQSAELEKVEKLEKPADQKPGKNQMISISTYEEQEAAFKNLMEKGAQNELKFSEKFLEIMKEAEEFYEAIFIDESYRPPKGIKESIEYQLVNPEEMADLARDYKIILEPHLMWIARVALVLPLPPLWKTEINALGEKVYINTEINNPQTEPPYHSFLNKYIQRARQIVPDTGEKFMTFYDKDCVRYVVDLAKLQTKKGYILDRDPQPDPDLQKRAAYFKPQMTSEEALTDIMIFEIAQSVGIDMNKELHLISAVYQIIETIKSKNILKNWDFRITMEGNKYWYNTKDKKSVTDFPYKDEIKKYVRVVRKEAISNAKSMIRTFSERHSEFQLYGKEFYERCKREAFAVTESLIKKHINNNEIFQPSGLVKAHLKKKDSEEEYLDLLFASPFNFGINLATDFLFQDQGYLVIDRPIDPEKRTFLVDERMSEQLESSILEKERKIKEEKDLNLRYGRPRRNTTINIDSIPNDLPIPRITKYKTMGREEDGVIAEEESAEEDSKLEEKEESSDSDDYEELQKLVEEKIEQPKPIAKISTLRMAASRKNTIESIMIKEKKISLTEYRRSSSGLSDMQSDDSPEAKELQFKNFSKLTVTPLEVDELSGNSKSQIEKDENLEENQELDREEMGEEGGLAEKGFENPEDLPENEENKEEPNKRSKRHSIKLPKAEIKSDSISNLSEITNEKAKEDKFEVPDKKVSLISSERKNTDLKKAKIRDESSDQMEFSSIASKSDHHSINESDFAEIELDRKHEEVASRAEVISSTLKAPLIYSKTLKSVIFFEDDKIKINPNLAKPDPQLSQKIRIPDPLRSETMKLPSFTNELVRKTTSPEALNKIDWESSLHKGIIYSTKKPEIKSPVHTPKHSLTHQLSFRRDNTLISPRNDSVISQKPVKSAEKEPEKSETSLLSERFDNEVPLVSDQVLRENFENTKKIFQEVFSPLTQRPPVSSPILLPKAANLNVFGAHVLKISRSEEEPVKIRPKKLDPIDEKLVIQDDSESSKSKHSASVNFLEKPLNDSKKLKPIKKKTENKNVVVQEKLLFLYYLELVGHPTSSRSSLNYFYVQRHIQPYDVLSMAKRLGLRVSNVPFGSIDSDLVWIAYLQIATPMPTGFNSHTKVSTMLNWPLGKHPGDVYFTLLCKCQKKLRDLELKKMNKQQKIESLIGFSWCRFLNEKNKNYFINFLTWDKTEHQPQLNENYDVHIGAKKKNKLKETLTQDSDIRDILMIYDIKKTVNDGKYYNLSNYIIQTMMENESIDENFRESEMSSNFN